MAEAEGAAAFAQMGLASALPSVCAALLGASALLVFDYEDTGPLARAVAKSRPSMPIAALSASLKVCRQLAISHGVQPIFVDDDAMARFSDIDTADLDEVCAFVCERTDLLKPAEGEAARS